MRSRLVHPATLVLVVIALGFGLRLFHLDAQSFWYDEAYSARVARGSLTQILRNDYTDVHPPLYYAVLHYWLAIDQGDFVVRLLSTMLGVAGIAATYCLGTTLFDNSVGLVAATIAALAPYPVFYSQEARMYALLFLLAATVVLSYVHILRTPSRLWWLAYTVSAVLSVYVHYLSALLLLSLHLHFLVHRTSRARQWRGLFVSDALLVLAFAPQFTILVTQAQRVAGGEWISQPSLARVFSAPYTLILSQLTSEALVPLAYVLVLFLFTITHLQAARELARQGRSSAELKLLICAFWGPLLLAFIISQWRAVYLERGLIVVAPTLYVLLSWGAVRMRERHANLAMLLVMALFCFRGLQNWYFDPSFGKPPFRTAAQFLQNTAGASDPILHTSDGGFLVFLHYARGSADYLLEGDPRPHLPLETYRRFGGKTVAKEEVDAPQFWLVVALDNSIDFQRGLVDWFDARYTLCETHTLDGIYLRHYDGRQDLQE